MSHYLFKPKLTPTDSLATLIENRTKYSFSAFELNVFETHQKAESVHLTFNDFVLTSMFRGKKVMHLTGKDSFDYLPGESVIAAPGETMCIDFPEARTNNPTQCLAIEISKDLIKNTVSLLNEKNPKPQSCGNWKVDDTLFHLLNNEDLTNTIDRVVHLSIYEQNKNKDLLLDLTMKEMLVRLMQTQARELIQKKLAENNSDPMSAVVAFMKENLSHNFSMEQLAKKAYMSRASFFKKFKEMFGLTPREYLLKLKIEKAKKELAHPEQNVSEAAFAAGFENLSHFATAFKREVGMTPGAYKSSVYQE